MSGQSDREKLAQLARQKEETRLEAERNARRPLRAAAVLPEADADLSRTADLLAYFGREFEEYELRTTARHRVAVDRGGPARRSGLTPDGVDYATLTISECGVRTHSYRGRITLLQARYRHGQYELLHGADRETFECLESLQARLAELLVGFDDETLEGVFAYIRSIHPRPFDKGER